MKPLYPWFDRHGSRLNWLQLLSLLMLMLISSTTGAMEAVTIATNLVSESLGPYTEYLEDSSRSLSLADAQGRTGEFIPNSSEVMNFGYTSAGYWVRFRLRNDSAESLPLFLQFRSRFADHLSLFIPSAAGDYSVVRSGRMVKPSQRPHISREFVFPLTIPAHSDQTYYLYTDSADTLTVPLYLMSAEGLRQDDITSHTWMAFYQGLVVTITIFSIFMLVTVRDQVYLFYIFTVVLHHGLFFALFDGLGYTYFGLENPWWTREALSALVAAAIWMVMQFSRLLLNTREQLPRLDKLIIAMQWAAAFTAVLSLFVDYYVSIRIANPVATLAVTLMWVIGWNSFRQGHSAARYYLLAWTLVIAGGLTYSLKAWGFAPSNLFTEYAWQIGSGLEAILLSMAIAERINIEIRQRIRSQQEAQTAQKQALEVQRRANETLEHHVRERTEELEKANRKLQELSETDQLTGIKNRRFLDRYIEHVVDRAIRYGHSVAVLLIDVDHFKAINDTHGHLVGDDCLREIAQRVASQCRWPIDLAARYGGEEFCMVLPESGADAAQAVAERIRRCIAATPVATRIGPLELTVSIGAHAMVPTETPDGARILTLADQALYVSKERGRNCVTLGNDVNDDKTTCMYH